MGRRRATSGALSPEPRSPITTVRAPAASRTPMAPTVDLKLPLGAISIDGRTAVKLRRLSTAERTPPAGQWDSGRHLQSASKCGPARLARGGAEANSPRANRLDRTTRPTSDPAVRVDVTGPGTTQIADLRQISDWSSVRESCPTSLPCAEVDAHVAEVSAAASSVECSLSFLARTPLASHRVRSAGERSLGVNVSSVQLQVTNMDGRAPSQKAAARLDASDTPESAQSWDDEVPSPVFTSFKLVFPSASPPTLQRQGLDGALGELKAQQGDVDGCCMPVQSRSRFPSETEVDSNTQVFFTL